jgi:DinB superfamily
MSTPAAASVTPERYTKALAGRDAVEAMRKAPKRFKKLVKQLSEKELAWKPAPNRWSIKEVLAHLADGEVILGARVRFVAAMDNPPLPGYDQDLFVARLGIEQVKSKALFEAFTSMRALNVALLERLPKESFARSGLHAERGPESIRKMVDMYAGHDVLHEQQIERVLAEHRDADGAKKKAKAEDKAARASAKSDKKSRKAEKKARKEAEVAATKRKDDGDAKAAKKSDEKKEKRKLEALLAGR